MQADLQSLGTSRKANRYRSAKRGVAMLAVIMGLCCLCGCSLAAAIGGGPDTVTVNTVPLFPGKVLRDYTDYNPTFSSALRQVQIQPADPDAVYAFYKQTLSTGNYVRKDARLYLDDPKYVNYCIIFQSSLFGGLVQRTGSLQISGKKTKAGTPDPTAGVNLDIASNAEVYHCLPLLRPEGTQPAPNPTASPIP